MNLAARARATDAVLAQYRDRAFDWSGANCIRLARAQAVALGHQVPPVPLFRSATGAVRALRKRGAGSVAELLDRWFVPILPAQMIVGDLATLPTDPAEPGALAAVVVADGIGNLFGWHDADPSRLSVIKFAAADIVRAWRL